METKLIQIKHSKHPQKVNVPLSTFVAKFAKAGNNKVLVSAKRTKGM